MWNDLRFGLRRGRLATFAGGVGALFVTALLASYLPTRRALRVDPAVALRDE